MAIFVSASDETAGKNNKEGSFFVGGWIMPQEDWSSFFEPAWQERVLNGPPAIPYLHMTDIRSSKWRERYGLSRSEADRRIDEALAVISTMGSMYRVHIEVDSGHFRGEMNDQKLIAKGGGAKKYQPDYICFTAYAYAVLKHLHLYQPEAERVDFMVEKNGEITDNIEESHSHLGESLEEFGEGALVRLIGKFIPAGKEQIPVQAADVLCWHLARGNNQETMDEDDVRRYICLGLRNGNDITLPNESITQLKCAMDTLQSRMKTQSLGADDQKVLPEI